MRKRNYYLTLIVFISLFAMVSCNQYEPLKTTIVEETSNLKNGDIIPGKYIVTFRSDVIAESRFKRDMSYTERTEMASSISLQTVKDITGTDCEIEHAYHATIKGFSGALSEEQVEKLEQDPRVESIEPDRVVMLAPPPGKGPKDKDGGGDDGGSASQVTPWGIARVVGTGGDYAGSNRAWILDSGIDLDHPDLNVNTNLSKSFLSGKQSNNPSDDQNGHGTHVAGTVAAIDNDEGVIGVAPGAEVVSVRVLDRRGSGSYSGVIAGIDYVRVTALPGDVANMSLGGPASSAVDNAVKAAAAAGIYFCVAAGNDYGNADSYSPARVNANRVFTVSAMNSNDNWASFSNSSAQTVDYCEPGVGVESCWKNGGYNTISGTSMATPHLAGIILMTNGAIQTDGTVNNDPDGNSDPIGVVN